MLPSRYGFFNLVLSVKLRWSPMTRALMSRQCQDVILSQFRASATPDSLFKISSFDTQVSKNTPLLGPNAANNNFFQMFAAMSSPQRSSRWDYGRHHQEGVIFIYQLWSPYCRPVSLCSPQAYASKHPHQAYRYLQHFMHLSSIPLCIHHHDERHLRAPPWP